MVFALTCAIIGVLLIAMTLGGSFVARLPLSAAMLYLAVGYGIGPAGLGLIAFDPLRNPVLLERLSEAAVLISLFTTGFKLELPLADRRWRIPVQLASASMLITVAAITLAGVFLLGLPLGAAILLAGILAPTDPVLASDVQVANPGDRDRLRFGLTGEAGLNDGTAFPIVMLGLGLLSLHELGENLWRWWTLDVLWAIGGGLAIGYVIGLAVGRTVLYLRTRHREALGAEEFIAFGLIVLVYGAALLCHTYGFLAVFAAGLALRRTDDRSTGRLAVPRPQEVLVEPHVASEAELATATHPKSAPAHLLQAVQRFNAQLERFAEVAIVLAVGAVLAVIDFQREVVWFIPLLFLIIRPLAVYLGLVGTDVAGAPRLLMAWFGIRGIGSIYYLMYAISHGIAPALAERLLSITVAVVVVSVIAHGISVTPLMARYERRVTSKRDARDA